MAEMGLWLIWFIDEENFVRCCVCRRIFQLVVLEVRLAYLPR